MDMTTFQALEHSEMMSVEGGLIGFVPTLPAPPNLGSLLLKLILNRLG